MPYTFFCCEAFFFDDIHDLVMAGGALNLYFFSVDIFVLKHFTGVKVFLTSTTFFYIIFPYPKEPQLAFQIFLTQSSFLNYDWFLGQAEVLRYHMRFSSRKKFCGGRAYHGHCSVFVRRSGIMRPGYLLFFLRQYKGISTLWMCIRMRAALCTDVSLNPYFAEPKFWSTVVPVNQCSDVPTFRWTGDVQKFRYTDVSV